MRLSRTIWTSLALLLAAGAGTALGAAVMQEPQDAAAKMPKAGPEHEIIKKDSGTWTATVKHWTSASAQPMEMTGTEVNTLECNGLWMMSHFDTDDGSFSGRGLSGWDAAKKKYVSVWVDSGSMNMAVSEGAADKDKNTVTYTGKCPDPETGKMQTNRSVLEHVDANNRKYTVWTTPEGGKEFKALEINYTRSK